MAGHLLDEFEDRARKGDGQFAIAYALLRLAETSEHLRSDLCYGSTAAPGVLENVGMELGNVAKAVQAVADMSRD
jgi:hypothetical protein